jgi:hypothetical protein
MFAKSRARRNASHRRSIRWSRLLLLVSATAMGIVLVAGVVLVLATPVTIDTFDTGKQAVRADDGGEYATYDSDSLDTAASLGGERDVAVTWVSGGGSPVAVLIDTGVGAGTNQLKFDQGSGILGTAEIVWDGDDSDPDSLDTGGLGGTDLTNGGANDGVQLLVYEGDGSFDLGMRIYSNTTTAYYTLTMSTDVDPPGQSFFIPFADFTGDQSVFTSTGAVVFKISPGAAAVDLTLDLFEATSQTDLGDLPENGTVVGGIARYYTTTAAYNGPRHVYTGTTKINLGAQIDLEADGFPSDNADGDDNNNHDDEDGIERHPDYQWQPENTVHITATVNGDGGYLVGWFDWNNDGDLDDSGEMELFGTVNNGENDLEFTVDDAYTTGQDLYARFRLYDGNPGTPQYSGEVTNGEVEDYKWEFEPTAVTLSSFTIRLISSQGSFFHWQWLALVGAVGLAFGGGAAAMRKRVLRR